MFLQLSEVTRTTPLPLADLAQQAEFYALPQAWTLAMGKTPNTYMDSLYAFEVARDLGMYKQGLLTSNGGKIKSGSCVQNLLGAIPCQYL